MRMADLSRRDMGFARTSTRAELRAGTTILTLLMVAITITRVRINTITMMGGIIPRMIRSQSRRAITTRMPSTSVT